jgi:hypothetical protein
VDGNAHAGGCGVLPQEQDLEIFLVLSVPRDGDNVEKQ